MKAYIDHEGIYWHFFDFLNETDMEIILNTFYQELHAYPMEKFDAIVTQHNLRLEQ